jgi:hypothetical protein
VYLKKCTVINVIHISSLCSVCLFFFLLVIVLSVLLRITTCDYPFDMFKLFLKYMDFDKSLMKMCTKAYANIPTYTCTYMHVFITLIMDIQRHFAKYDLVNLLQDIHNSAFHKIMMKSRAFSFGHCVVCPSSNYHLWLPLWYVQTISEVHGFW